MSSRIEESLHKMPLRRKLLPAGDGEAVAEAMQRSLVELIDLSLQGKQAHWNLHGPNFRSVHLQLDEIIDSLRNGSDEVAERIVTIGFTPDGRASTVAEHSALDQFPEGALTVEDAIHFISDRLAGVITRLREAIGQVDERDPVSGDLLIGLTRELEKHLWMLQAQES
jgi:starvation-inducible DNA-binding protein